MKLFISYAHKDITVVEQLVDLFRQAGHDPWYDHALKAGQPWQTQLSDQIASCDVFVYVMTPNSAWSVSEWCHWEFVTAVEQGKPVLPLLMQKTDEDFKLPQVISRLQYVDLTEGWDDETIRKMLSDLEDLRVTNTRDLPDKPANPSGEPSRVEINQTVNASGNAQVNMIGQQHQRDTVTIGTQINQSSSNVAGFVFVGFLILVVIVIFGAFLFRNELGLTSPTATPTATAIPTETKTPTLSPTPTVSDTPTAIATPATPIIQSDESTVIRTGPGVGFDTLTTWDGRSLDILGVSTDGGWYQVLLRDGRRGWVISSQNVVDVNGDRSIIPTIVITNTPTLIPTNTPKPTATATDTPTLTKTLTNTPTYTPSPTLTPSHTPMASPTPVASHTPTPPEECVGTIPGAGGLLNQVKALPNPSAPPRTPVQRGSTVVILQQIEDFGSVWYQIRYENNEGWINEDYIDVPSNCP